MATRYVRSFCTHCGDHLLTFSQGHSAHVTATATTRCALMRGGFLVRTKIAPYVAGVVNPATGRLFPAVHSTLLGGWL